MQNNCSSEFDLLRNRWNTPDGKNLIHALFNPEVPHDEETRALNQFFGVNEWFIETNTCLGTEKLVDLRGMDVSDTKVSRLNCGEDLSYTNFSNCQLDGASFNYSKFYHANFTDAQAVKKRVQFVQASGQFSVFRNAHFKSALFTHADLRGADFSGALLEDCDFNQALLQCAIFDDVRIRNCSINRARLSAKERDAEWFRTGAVFDEEFPPIFEEDDVS